jgi:hypothetical protein
MAHDDLLMAHDDLLMAHDDLLMAHDDLLMAHRGSERSARTVTALLALPVPLLVEQVVPKVLLGEATNP